MARRAKFIDRACGQIETARFLGLHPNSLPRMVRRHTFPPPFKKTPGGRDNAWMLSTIVEYLRQRQIEAGLIGPDDPPIGNLGQEIGGQYATKETPPADDTAEGGNETCSPIEQPTVRGPRQRRNPHSGRFEGTVVAS